MFFRLIIFTFILFLSNSPLQASPSRLDELTKSAQIFNQNIKKLIEVKEIFEANSVVNKSTSKERIKKSSDLLKSIIESSKIYALQQVDESPIKRKTKEEHILSKPSISTEEETETATADKTNSIDQENIAPEEKIILAAKGCNTGDLTTDTKCTFSNSDQRLQEFAEQFDLEPSEAAMLISIVATNVKKVLKGIVFIADSRNRYYEKLRSGGMIDQQVDRFFTGENSTVEVSSLKSKRTRNFPVRNYLERLASYSANANNGKNGFLRIFFADKLIVGNISRDADNDAIFPIDTFQLWIGCVKNSEGKEKCYADITRKTLVTKLKIDRENIEFSKARLDWIAVKDTFSTQDCAVQNLSGFKEITEDCK